MSCGADLFSPVPQRSTWTGLTFLRMGRFCALFLSRGTSTDDAAYAAKRFLFPPIYVVWEVPPIITRGSSEGYICAGPCGRQTVAKTRLWSYKILGQDARIAPMSASGFRATPSTLTATIDKSVDPATWMTSCAGRRGRWLPRTHDDG